MVSTPLKNMLVKFDHFPRDRGEHSKKYLSCHHLATASYDFGVKKEAIQLDVSTCFPLPLCQPSFGGRRRASQRKLGSIRNHTALPKQWRTQNQPMLIWRVFQLDFVVMTVDVFFCFVVVCCLLFFFFLHCKPPKKLI